MNSDSIKYIDMGLGHVPVLVGPDTPVSKFVTEVGGYGLHGAESLAGVGATMAEAVVANAGGISAIVSGVVCTDNAEDKSVKFKSHECGFGPGTSIFKSSFTSEGEPRYTITSILLRLAR